MQPILVMTAIVGFGAVLFLWVYFFLSSNNEMDEMAKRLQRYGGGSVDVAPQRVATGNAVRDMIAPLGEALNPLLARSSYSGQLAEELAKADLRIKSSEWILAILGIGTFVGLIVALRFGVLILFLVGPISVWLGAGVYLRIRQGRRRRAFERQLGDTMILLSNALKAGYSFAQALSTVSKSAGPPIGDEFARATREVALGINVDDALNHMVQRNNSEDFDLMVTAVQIQRVAGGNLAEILDTIAFTIRERVRIQGEIRTLTAQARFSGIIITILPIALGVILMFISPDYFSPMFKKTLGWVMMSVGVVSMIIGYGLIQKIVKIEV